MAITPQKAAQDRLAKESHAIEALEKLCDEHLTKNYDGRSKVSVRAPDGTTQFVIDEVMRRFRAVGWKVEHKGFSDQFDRDYFQDLIFSSDVASHYTGGFN